MKDFEALWDKLNSNIDKKAIKKIADNIDDPAVMDDVIAHWKAGFILGFSNGCITNVCCSLILHEGRDKIGPREIDRLADFCIQEGKDMNSLTDRFFAQNQMAMNSLCLCLEFLVDVLQFHGVELGRRILQKIDDSYPAYQANEFVWIPLGCLSFEATDEEKSQIKKICIESLETLAAKKIKEQYSNTKIAAILGNIADKKTALNAINKYYNTYSEAEKTMSDLRLIKMKIEGDRRIKEDFIFPEKQPRNILKGASVCVDYLDKVAYSISDYPDYDEIEEIQHVNTVQDSPGVTFYPGITGSDKIGRNEPCLCGSGKKFKKCCGK